MKVKGIIQFGHLVNYNHISNNWCHRTFGDFSYRRDNNSGISSFDWESLGLNFIQCLQNII